VILSVLHFEPTERTAILGKRNLAFKLYAQCLETIEVNLLTSSYVNVFCRCVAAERVAMESGDTVRVTGCRILFEYGLFQAWLESAAIRICKK
jgi:hypothetical protein